MSYLFCCLCFSKGEFSPLSLVPFFSPLPDKMKIKDFPFSLSFFFSFLNTKGWIQQGLEVHYTVPGILQARVLEWVAISFSSVWKWKVKVKSLSRVWPLSTPWTAAHQAPPSMGVSRQEYWSGVPLSSSPNPRYWFQDIMDLRFLMPHHRKNLVIDKGIGNTWIFFRFREKHTPQRE